ncbi:hypothetical protein QYF50_06440 [Paenibacillus vini]|uniref:hypothetical protein n=1 Tax=Paenibacillus vini TaxID=1476024 RepID=UPI0025B666AB|nr:hypothetical protein [Paenibacillus vini]MDN4067529.1 hypothetical protein [Paenibacillus vini]
MMEQNKPIKVQDVSQKQIINHRRKLRNELLKQMGERAAITEKRAEVLLKA